MEEAGSTSPHLGASEQGQAASHAPLRALVIHEILREQGEQELRRTSGALFFSALAAGLSMGLSFLTTALIRAGLPEAPWRHLLASAGYTVGFVAVILGRQQLFTENTLTAVLPVLTGKGRGLATMFRVWAFVLAGNIIGTWLFAAAMTIPGLFEPPTVDALGAVSAEAMAKPPALTFATAVMAGWLIALMVWLTPSAKSAKLLVVMLMTYVIALGRLSHIIAGSTDVAYAVLIGQAGAGDYLMGFFLPTLFGNIVGGVGLAALLNHAPIADELDEAPG